MNTLRYKTNEALNARDTRIINRTKKRIDRLEAKLDKVYLRKIDRLNRMVKDLTLTLDEPFETEENREVANMNLTQALEPYEVKDAGSIDH